MNKLHQIPVVIRSMAAVAMLMLGSVWAAQALAERDGHEWADARRQQAPSNEQKNRGVEQRDRSAPPSAQADRRAGSERREAHRSVERFGPAERLGPAEWIDRREGRFRSPSWEFDARFRHDRFYPRRGSVINALPPGYSRYRFRSNNFYFYGGVWFRNVGLNYVVTLPPAGIYISALPPDYTTLWIDSVPYYYANGVYYTQALDAPGYVVTDPPLGIDTATVQSAPPSAAIVVPSPETSPGAAVDSEPLFVYPRSGQSEAQTVKDRNECNQWGSGQTGFDPASGTADEQQRSNYRRAVGACLEGRGYTVK